MRRLVCAIVLALFASSAIAPDAAGLWEGSLDLGAIKMRLAFKIEKKPDGSFSGKMDSPDQGAKDVPLDSVKLEDNKLTLKLTKAKAEYTGTLSADGKSIAGEWKQSGHDFPLELKRVEKLTVIKRPQNPVKPYPYHEEDVTIDNAAAKVKLAGTFTKPKEGGPFPAVVLITGSGPQDRDETLLGHKPFLVIADYLTRHGIAVLRCDDRGVGKSTGDHAKCTSADFATDAYASLKYLRGRPDVNPKRVGFIGHSEGGIIAPMVAAAHPDEVDFIVMLAGTGLPGDEVLGDQLIAVMKAMGTDEHEIGLRSAMQHVLLNVAKQGGKSEELKTKLAAAVAAHIESLNDADRKFIEKEGKAKADDFARLASPWMVYFLGYDPRPALRKVRCPVLALNGDRDVQVTPKENLAAVGQALKEAGNTRVTLREFPELNHLFQHCKTGSPTEYGAIEETIAPEVLETMAKWILGLGK